MSRLDELERHLEHTIPPEGGADSQALFRRMTERALSLLAVGGNGRVLDLACGMGQDTLALARRRTPRKPATGAESISHTAFALTVGLEPSERMIRWGQNQGRREMRDGSAQFAPPPRVAWVRGFGEELPFRGECFEAVLCKGAMDHFASPPATLAEMARLLRPGGRAVLAIANYDSLSCRLGRLLDRWRGWRRPGYNPAPFPYYEPPPDHLTRFGYRDILRLPRPTLRPTRVEGISLLWGFPPWGAFLGSLPHALQRAALAVAFAVGRIIPAWADVIVVQAVKDG